jgi:hypothetical protein
MTIHENISDDNGVHVAVQGEVAPRSPVGDLQIMSDSLRCEYAVGTLIDGEPKDAVKILFVVDLVDPTGTTPPAQVSVRAVDDLSEQDGGLPERDTDFPVGQEGSLVILLNEAVYTRPSTGLTLEVDPGQSVAETDHSNNTLHMKFALPEQSGGPPTQSEWVPLQHCDPIQ